jgi:hypothetical protein
MALEYSRVTVAGLLVTLPEAKAHLRILDTTHDADISQKLDTAQEAILAYEALAGDATWTDATVPRAVKHAILLLLTHYYEDRGEDLERDEKVWTAIRELLGRHRDPTLG